MKPLFVYDPEAGAEWLDLLKNVGKVVALGTAVLLVTLGEAYEAEKLPTNDREKFLEERSAYWLSVFNPTKE